VIYNSYFKSNIVQFYCLSKAPLSTCSPLTLLNMARKSKNDTAAAKAPKTKLGAKAKVKPAKKAEKGVIVSDSEGHGEDGEDDKVDIKCVPSHQAPVTVILRLIKLCCSWTNDLCSTLISAITDDTEIKQGLFPSPGANPRTGGKTKATYHWALCVLLFAEHEDYKEVFARLTTPKQKQTWANKIKNKLKR